MTVDGIMLALGTITAAAVARDSSAQVTDHAAMLLLLPKHVSWRHSLLPFPNVKYRRQGTTVLIFIVIIYKHENYQRWYVKSIDALTGHN